MDIYELLSLLHSDKQIQRQQAQQRGVYRDEPIIRTASQMMQAVPQQIRAMRSLSGRTADGIRTQEALFYEQGVFMKDFEDSYPLNDDFVRYYPTYQSLNDRQLRGYFTWRKAVRSGEIRKAPTAYAFLYVYELLNLIGVSDAQAGYRTLRGFYEAYLPFDHILQGYVPQWLDDFCIYYHLPFHSQMQEADEKLSVIQNRANCTDHERLLAMSSVSSYAVVFSLFYKENPALLERVACMAYDALTACDEDSLSRFFGQKQVRPYHPFETAVFYERSARKEDAYTPSPVRTYRCVNGVWTQHYYSLTKGKSAQMTAFLRAVDSRLRVRTGFRSKLKTPACGQEMLEAIESCMDTVLEEQRKANLPQVTLDLSKLQGIRSASEDTREKLISEEERAEIAAESIESPVLYAAQTPTAALPALSEPALALLKRLLYGGDFADILAQAGVIASVVADEINEGFYDAIGDSVLEYDGSDFALIEDYIEDLKNMIPKE